jgi:maleylacetoacetate isomerase
VPVRALYSYFRSSAAWRVRIALAFKGLDATVVPVHLRRDGGEQNQEAYRAINPQGLVPLLIEDGAAIAQSLAICEFLEEKYPSPPLLPVGAVERAQVRAFVCAIACDIHPIDNLRVLQYLRNVLGHTQGEIDEWYRHWIRVGFEALESLIARQCSQQACVGDNTTLADVFLVPQVANARRLHLDLAPYPNIVRVDAHLMTLAAFRESAPDRQPDYEAN